MTTSKYYEILGVPETASPEEIKTAYRICCKEYHPDVNKAPNAAAMFRFLNEAYMALTTPQTPGGEETYRETGRETAQQQSYSQEHDAEPSQPRQRKSPWWMVILKIIRKILCTFLIPIPWLLKGLVTIIGVIGYLLAILSGIGAVIAFINALSGAPSALEIGIVALVFAAILYLITIFSSFLSAALDTLHDYLIGIVFGPL